jgi:SAM-dependent methyltransferase
MYVQYGCGPISAPKEWVNFDASMTLKFERVPVIGRLYTKNAQRFPENAKWGDIVRGLPLPDASCQGVYASHVLEHLPLTDFHQALKNTRRILAPNGIFRLVVPDLEWAGREYVRMLDSGEQDGNAFFLHATGLGRKDRRKGIVGLVFDALRTSTHFWMWDERSLATVLETHGFHSVRRCQCGDSGDPMFGLVEDKHRFHHAVAIEARG